MSPPGRRRISSARSYKARSKSRPSVPGSRPEIRYADSSSVGCTDRNRSAATARSSRRPTLRCRAVRRRTPGRSRDSECRTVAESAPVSASRIVARARSKVICPSARRKLIGRYFPIRRAADTSSDAPAWSTSSHDDTQSGIDRWPSAPAVLILSSSLTITACRSRSSEIWVSRSRSSSFIEAG